MTIHRSNRFTANPGQGGALVQEFARVIPAILAAEGCVSCQLFQSDQTPDNILIMESWESVEAHQNAAKNIKQEDFARIIALLNGKPEGEYFRLVT